MGVGCRHQPPGGGSGHNRPMGGVVVPLHCSGIGEQVGDGVGVKIWMGITVQIPPWQVP